MEKILKSGKMTWHRVPASSGPIGKTWEGEAGEGGQNDLTQHYGQSDVENP